MLTLKEIFENEKNPKNVFQIQIFNVKSLSCFSPSCQRKSSTKYKIYTMYSKQFKFIEIHIPI